MGQWFWSRRWKYEKFTITLTKTTKTDNGLLENISFLKKLMKETSETIVLAPSRTFFLHSHTDNILYTYDRNIQYILNIKRRHFEYSITSKILIRNYIYIYIQGSWRDEHQSTYYFVNDFMQVQEHRLNTLSMILFLLLPELSRTFKKLTFPLNSRLTRRASGTGSQDLYFFFFFWFLESIFCLICLKICSVKSL